MTGVSAVGIHDDLAAREARIGDGAAFDEASRGIDIDLRVIVQPLVGDHGIDDVFFDVLTNGVQINVLVVLGAHYDVFQTHRLAVSVFHRDLGLSVGTKIGQCAILAHLGKLLRQSVGQRNRQGHAFLGFVAGIAEHNALVPGAECV